MNDTNFGKFASDYTSNLIREEVAPLFENTKSVKNMVSTLLNGRPELDPVTVASFLNFQPTLAGKIDNWTNEIVVGGAKAAVGGVALGMLMKAIPGFSPYLESLPLNLPIPLHEALQVLHGAALNTSPSQNALNHTVTLLQDGGLFGAYASVIGNVVKGGIPKVGPAQERLLSILKLGGKESLDKVGGIERIKWKMADGHTQFFGAIGDPFAALLAAKLGNNELMVYADQKPDFSNTWTKLDKRAGNIETTDAYEAGSFKNAGEFVISSSTGIHSFLPGAEDFDFNPLEVSNIVGTIRKKESEDGIQPRKVVLVGDSHQKYTKRAEDALGAEVVNRRREITFETIKANDENVVIIDPTEVAINAIFEANPSRNYVFGGEEDSIKKYRQQFYSRLTLQMEEFKGIKDADGNPDETERIRQYHEACQAGKYGEQVEILYNIVDAPTVHEASSGKRPDQIAIILEQQSYDELVPDKENPPKNVIFLPELVKEKILNAVKPPEEAVLK